MAACSYNLDAVRCLLAYGAQPNSRDLADSTPLTEAAKRNLVEIVRVLLQDQRTRVNQLSIGLLGRAVWRPQPHCWGTTEPILILRLGRLVFRRTATLPSRLLGNRATVKW
ncbi:unnamed protein product [Tuber aestivum]|uniref:Uncharacterized protein n=1 Tax=Tuber aestivum TaxID=59557 RepID=A0A292PMP6_9PEZI|nr:unnamed protein product [Tuber aestivum]